MKWFFSLDQYSDHFASYAEMTQVAVHSARRNTTLEMVCLFDGDVDHEIAQWMRDNGVTVRVLRTPFYTALKALAESKNDPNILSFGAGAFLRLEIPQVIAREKWDDKYVLYTDADVMFLRDPCPALEAMHLRWFRVAPEGDPNDVENVNTGVMLINVRAMSRIDEQLHQFCSDHLDNFVDYRAGNAFDQAMFRAFFRPLTRRLVKAGLTIPLCNSRGYSRYWGRFYVRFPQLDRPQWQALPLTLNWKSYWPDEKEEAIIVHFHGPKPNEKRLETSPESLKRDNEALDDLLPQLRNEWFYRFCAKWNAFLQEL